MGLFTLILLTIPYDAGSDNMYDLHHHEVKILPYLIRSTQNSSYHKVIKNNHKVNKTSYHEVNIPIGSMYGIFTHIGIILNYINGVNVGKYSSTS